MVLRFPLLQYNHVYPHLSYLDTVQPHLSGPQVSGYSTTFIQTSVIQIQYLIYPYLSYLDTVQPHLSGPQLSGYSTTFIQTSSYPDTVLLLLVSRPHLSGYSTTMFIQTSFIRIQCNLVYLDLSYPDTVQPRLSGPRVWTSVICIQYNLIY